MNHVQIGPTVLANDRNGGRLRLNASRHDDDDDGDYLVADNNVKCETVASTRHPKLHHSIPMASVA